MSQVPSGSPVTSRKDWMATEIAHIDTGETADLQERLAHKASNLEGTIHVTIEHEEQYPQSLLRETQG